MAGTDPVHASAVAWHGRGLLIQGKSGSGKSSLALELMAFGATLIADDRVLLRRDGDHIVASCPPTLRGLIEARGVGVLRARPAASAKLVAVADLDDVVDDRLPGAKIVTLLGCELPLIQRPKGISFAPALLQYLRAGRMA